AWLTRQQGVPLAFPWLPLTLLNPRDFTDHHLLFHLALVPFTFWDLRLGAKAAGLVFGALAVFSTYLVMAGLRIRYRLLWLAVLINPYFPNNVRFTYLHVLARVLLQADVSAGVEWQPYSAVSLLRTSWLALLLLPLGLLPALLEPRRALRDYRTVFFGALACLFTLMYLRARRFVEIEPAFGVLLCAYTW